MAVKFHIDFSRPIALFPLAGVAIYPHTADWIRVFEPRYRQMVEDCLRARGDGPLLDAAPIAMASYAGRDWKGERVGDPPLRKAVCVAKIVDHRPQPDGTHHILVHGFSRAVIETVAEPEGRRLYRLARLSPIDQRLGAPRRMPSLEGEIAALITQGELARMERLDPVRDWIRRGNIPTEFILEQLLILLARGDDTRYRLLAEPSGRNRARFALSELAYLRRLLDRAKESGAPGGRGFSVN